MKTAAQIHQIHTEFMRLYNAMVAIGTSVEEHCSLPTWRCGYCESMHSIHDTVYIILMTREM